MLVDVIALAPVNYDSKKTGRHVEGTEVHYTRPLNESEKAKGVKGSKVTGIEFTRLDVSKVDPGKSYNFVYDLMGGKYPELVQITSA